MDIAALGGHRSKQSSTGFSNSIDGASSFLGIPELLGGGIDGGTVGAGTFLNVVALVLFGVSNSKDFNALPYASVILGLGGITFHLAQFHISNLFPRNRGLISSLLVAGFTGCGIIFYFLNLIFDSAGETR